MGSRMPLPRSYKPEVKEPSDSDASSEDATRRARCSHQHHRIAEALGIPVSALLDARETSNAVHALSGGRTGSDLALTRECLDLMQAYSRIRDPDRRRRFLADIRQAADEQTEI